MDKNNDTVSFISTPGFCSDCGSILPLLGDKGDVNCYGCKRSWGPEAFGDMAMSYTINFNTKNAYASSKRNVGQDEEEEEAEGPIVERKCPQCDNDKMSYATLQLRSADEGQTVFYTCTKCKYVLKFCSYFTALAMKAGIEKLKDLSSRMEFSQKPF